MPNLVELKSLRIAIWETYSRSCAYCHISITPENLQIDHIVPRSLRKSSAQEWQAHCSNIGIPLDFDIESIENLFPSCASCNSRKRDSIVQGKLPIFLSEASRKTPKVRDHQERIEKEWSSAKARTALMFSLDSGNLTLEDVEATISGRKQLSEPLKLSSSFPLFGENGLTNLTPSEYENYLDTALVLPEWMSDGLDLINTDGTNTLWVKTLREYSDAKANGFEATSNAGSKTAFKYFERPIQLLNIAKSSKSATYSYINNPRKGLADIDLLPATLLPLPLADGEIDTNLASASTIGDLVRDGKVVITQVSTDMISLRHDDERIFMFEIMRADTDDDGIEELVIHWGGGPIYGTLSFGEVKVLKRNSLTHHFKEALNSG